MLLYDSLIEEVPSFIKSSECRNYKYDEQNTWPESKDYELILQRDMAYELGGRGENSINCTLVTTNGDYAEDDEIILYGRELQEIQQDISYARIAIILVRDNPEWNSDSEKTYQILSDIDFVKYHIFPKGYMFRNSGQTGREQVRIGKKELSDGMNFEKIGNTIISHYKKHPDVLAVKLIFITGEEADYNKMEAAAKRSAQIRRSLSMINSNLPTECSICGIRDICNEVEGLRELHFGKKSADIESSPASGKKRREQKIIL